VNSRRPSREPAPSSTPQAREERKGEVCRVSDSGARSTRRITLGKLPFPTSNPSPYVRTREAGLSGRSRMAGSEVREAQRRPPSKKGVMTQAEEWFW